jgi:hypothetical protein
MYCHDRRGPEGYKCKGKEDCPLGVLHPPNGSGKSFAVGCGMCKELKIKGDLEEEMKGYEERLKKMKEEVVDF